MSTKTNDRPRTPAGPIRDGGGAPRFIAFAATVAPEAALAFVADLNAAVASVIAQHGARLEQPAYVVPRDREILGRMINDTRDADRRIERMAVRPGDVVGAWFEGQEYRFPTVLDVEPENEFGDGPHFILEGFASRETWASIDLPRNELQRLLWSLRPGSEVEVWCETTPDRLGRYSRDRRHPKGFKCSGRGEWHRVRVISVATRSLYLGALGRERYRAKAELNEVHMPEVVTEAFDFPLSQHSYEVSESDEGLVRFGRNLRRLAREAEEMVSQ